MNQEQQHIKVIMSGGGTGGHIFPAVAIANEIKSRFPKADILFVGAKDRMEMQRVPKAGYPIEGLWISGIQRKKWWKNFAFPFKLVASLCKSRRIINKFKPDVVIGTGGFASGAVLYVAQRKGIPTFIQEQNSYPGITNKLLAKKARKIYTAYEGLETYFPADKIVKTGNPIRKDLYDNKIDKDKALQRFGLQSGRKTILSVGGSLGARPVNEAVKNILAQIQKAGWQIIWQTGKNSYPEYRSYENDVVKVLPFITDMPGAYAAADVIISRAGAGTISELSLLGKPVVLVPSPYVAEDHQTKNALTLVANEAAVMIKENELSGRLFEELENLLNNQDIYDKYSSNIKKMALPDATVNIVDDIIKNIKTR